jgi:hypothetical protein
LTGRERFEAAAAGEALAFAPLLWDEVAELVHQPGDGWWRDPAAATRILVDAATLAGADALLVRALPTAVDELAAGGAQGDDALDGLAASAPVARAVALLERLAGSDSRAVVAVLPDAATLLRRMGAEDEYVAEDALIDLARAALEARADGLAVIGAEEAAVVPSGERAGGLAALFRRPVVSAVLGGGAWVEQRPEVPVGFLGEDGAWPAQDAGIVLTPGDVSGRWDVDALRAIGAARP